MATRPPTLSEILLDKSPPPWTLGAFMAYLSQNHCMETLEFTLDTQRYAAYYDKLVQAADLSLSPEACHRVCAWWHKLMQVYIIPCAPREVNIPARVRDRLLSLPSSPFPPHPCELEEASRIVYELMNDSLLVPFLQSVGSLHSTALYLADDRAPRPPNQPPALYTPGPFVTGPMCPFSALAHALDGDDLTDDSGSNLSPGTEPMTPPTTPPTSEWAFNPSPGGLHRAVAAHSKGWKKMGARLGFSRKSSNRRCPASASTPTESNISATSSCHPLPS